MRLWIGVAEPVAGKAESLAPRQHVSGDAPVRGRRLRDAVVFDHKQHRQTPEGGEVHRLVEQPLAEGSVANHDRDDGIAATKAARQCKPACDGGHAALHAIRMEFAGRHVLAAAAAAAKRALPAGQLGKEARRVAAKAQQVAMIAVIGQNVVLGKKRADHRHLAEFLAEAGMDGAGHMAVVIEPQRLLLRVADKARVSEDVQRIGGDRGPPAHYARRN